MFKPFPSNAEFVESAQEKASHFVYEQPTNDQLTKFIDDIQSTHWLTKDVDFTFDKAVFDSLDDQNKSVLGKILSFFAMAERAIIDNLDDNMERIIKCENVQYFIKSQLLAENIHAETYSKQLHNLFPNNFHTMVEGLIATPPIMAKNTWMRVNFTGQTLIMDRVLSAVFAEGILFQTSFAMISMLGHMRLRMPGILDANQYISRDEALHCKFFGFIYKEMKRACEDLGDYEERARAIWNGAIAVEKQFIDYLFQDGDFFSLTRDKMVDYLEFVAKGVWNMCDFPTKETISANPLPHMLTYNAPVLVNVFEQTATSYAHGVSVNGVELRNFCQQLINK